MRARNAVLGAVVLGVALAAVACMTSMPGRNPRSAQGLLDPRERTLREDLRADVQVLAGDIRERNTLHPAEYEQAADWVAARLRAAGLAVHEEAYVSEGATVRVRNLIGELRGTDRAGEIVVVGAHYDSAQGTPGADDNASGVAGLLALAERFAHGQPHRTLRFVAFANEEPPFFQTGQMGSLVYARGCADRRENVVAMISLETIGHYSDAPDSQHYPAPFSALYPSTGNFIAFVGNLRSQRLTTDAVRAFRGARVLPAEGAVVPDVTPGVGWSDHWSFWQTGVPAVMVTDTAPFRNANYHEATDLPETLDYERFARAVIGVGAVVERLASP